MSWSISYISAEAFRNDTPSSQSPQLADLAQESAEQVIAARQAALGVLESHCLGLRDVIVYLSGHANPNHEPGEGWANDTVTITLSQKS